MKDSANLCSVSLARSGQEPVYSFRLRDSFRLETGNWSPPADRMLDFHSSGPRSNCVSGSRCPVFRAQRNSRTERFIFWITAIDLYFLAEYYQFMLPRFVLASLLYSPIYLFTSFILFENTPEWIPAWMFIFLPLLPLFLFFWWIMHRNEIL